MKNVLTDTGFWAHYLIKKKGNRMRINFAGLLLGPFFLAGCGIELAVLGVAAVTSPVWVPLEYSNSQSKIVQPVEVVTVKNERVTPQFTENPVARFVLSKDTVLCTGRHNIRNSTDNGIKLECSNNLKGRLTISKFTTRDMEITIGPNSVPEKNIGTLSEVRFKCSGKYNVTKGGVFPFLINCPEKGAAVISPDYRSSDPEAFKVWIKPPV
jgi:hypothetical protein